jgi:hypothetical protein
MGGILSISSSTARSEEQVTMVIHAFNFWGTNYFLRLSMSYWEEIRSVHAAVFYIVLNILSYLMHQSTTC